MELRLQSQIQPTLKVWLTPKSALSLAILQKPSLDLKATVDQALADNPFLEADGTPERELSLDHLAETLKDPSTNDSSENDDPSAAEAFQEKRDRLFSLAAAPRSLREKLLEQLRVVAASAQELSIGEAILGNLTEDGTHATPVGEIAQALGVALEAVVQVLTQLPQLARQNR